MADYGGAPPRKSELLLRVFHWLSVLTNNLRSPDPESEPEKMLIDSGVYERIHRGEVRIEADL